MNANTSQFTALLSLPTNVFIISQVLFSENLCHSMSLMNGHPSGMERIQREYFLKWSLLRMRQESCQEKHSVGKTPCRQSLDKQTGNDGIIN